MQSKILSKQTLLIVGIAVSVFLLALFLNLFPQDFNLFGSSALVIENATPSPSQEEVIPTPEQPSFGLPMRLKIPSINIDASVEYVGLKPDGAMDVPKERANVAWFNLGSRPGENGGAVIAGHYGWENKKGSAFDDIHKLRKGDKLYVEDDKGAIISFVVRESRRYDPKADTSYIFGSIDGKPHLNLITCEGAWDESTQQYTKRLVVFTDKE